MLNNHIEDISCAWSRKYLAAPRDHHNNSIEQLHQHTFFNLLTAAFSFFSHFLAARCICLEVILRLTSSSSSDILFPMILMCVAVDDDYA